MKLIYQAFRRLLPLLPSNAKRILYVFSILSSALALLDIVALGLLTLVLGGLVSGGAMSIPLFGGTLPPGSEIWLLVAVCAIIILKSMLSVGLQWVMTRRFAAFELDMGDQLFHSYLKSSWADRSKRNTAELVRLADVGTANVISGFIIPITMMPAQVATFFAVLIVLVFAQPTTALITLVFLGLVGVAMYLLIGKKTLEAGEVQRYYTLRVAVLVTDMFFALKEVTLRNKTQEVADVVHRNRLHTTRSRANLSFLGSVPKFVVESALVGGFLLIGGVAYITGGAGEAFSAIALFGVAGFRMIPSLITFQGVISSATATLPQVDMIIDDILLTRKYQERAEDLGADPLPHRIDALTLNKVSFRYAPDAEPALRDVNLDIPFGSSLALVGHSGAGKSTLVDMLLGLLEPTEGDLTIDGLPLTDVLAAWRERVGYVPQDVILFDGTIAQNVALTWESNYDEEKVREALRRAQLLDVVDAREGGIHAYIGERGLALSGGQRQRMGIARALYSDPLVLVLDEATSALDTETESRVTKAIAELKGNVTLISVAHRLSTIRDSDQICFMADGQIVQSGSFETLVRDVPDFAVQAKLAGLTWEGGDEALTGPIELPLAEGDV